jgi:threonine 3-dehydrogenase
MASLITGGAGFIGAELAHMLVERGEDVVLFVRTVRKERIGDILDEVKVIQGDIGIGPHIFNAVKENKVTRIYHTGSMLATESDNNPWGSFQTNVGGVYNVLEAARLLDVERVMFTSTIGTYGYGVGSEITDTTLQRPHEMYGVGKLFGEGLGKFYRRRFGLDFRSIRYPTVTGPGVVTPGHWDAEMVEYAVAGKPYECQVAREATVPLMWYKDAARAADLVLQAPKDNIKMVNYNVAGIPGMVSANDLAQAVKRLIPSAVITFAKKPLPLSFHAYFKVWDDSCARKEWGWKPQHTDLNETLVRFIEELKARKKR